MSESRQLPLTMPPRTALGASDFAMTPANADAVAMLSAPGRWPRGRLALVGPPGAGKTHLVRMLFAEGDAHLIEPADVIAHAPPAHARHALVILECAERVAGNHAAESALFHLYNLLGEQGGRLLLTAQQTPAQWPLALPELASRLATVGVVRIDPDEGLVVAVMLKAAEDRGIDLAPDAITYLMTRIERDLGSVHALIAALDAKATGRKRRHVTKRLAGECLRELYLSGETADEPGHAADAQE
ncbi:MAG: DnaA/Hda family protein [Pseudomonadota bacterium]